MTQPVEFHSAKYAKAEDMNRLCSFAAMEAYFCMQLRRSTPSNYIPCTLKGEVTHAYVKEHSFAS